MNGASGASWFSRQCEASSGDGAEPVIGPRYARTRWRLLTMRVYGPTGFARRGKVLQSFQADLPRPVLREKRIPFTRDPNQSYKSRHPGPQEGRIAIVTNVGPGCGGRESAGRVMRIAGRVSRERSARARWTAHLRTAKPCGPGTRCWCQAGGDVFDPTGSFASSIRRRRRQDEFVSGESAA
jgi:hypothetical protein